MSSSENLLELVKQGDNKAIEKLLKQQLQARGITAKVCIENKHLEVVLESERELNQENLVSFLKKLGSSVLVMLIISLLPLYPSW